MRNGIVMLILVVGTAALLYTFFLQQPEEKSIPYSGGSGSFLGYVKQGAVDKVVQQGVKLTVTLNDKTVLVSQVPNEFSTNIRSDIEQVCAQEDAKCVAGKPEVSATEPSQTGQILTLLLTALLPVILIGAIFFFMMRQAQGTNNQALSFGKSRARMFLGNKTVVTFLDVAGVDEAKTELQEVVEFLKYPEKFNSLGARIPRGLLLVGQRGAGLGGSHDEREQTLNQILVEMDGFDTNTNVIVIAATNRPDVLDPALLRPGRFDRQVILDRPDIKGRTEILKVHVKGKPLDKTVELEALAKQSPGFSGADLANLVNEAAILAARRNRKTVSMPEFSEALDRVIAGPERRSRIISEAEKRVIAYHEGGHALVQKILPKCDPVTKVSIVSRGLALGYTTALPAEDRYLQSKSEFEDKIAGMLGGNASEKLVFGDTTTGASNDIEKATNLARRMVTEFGMSEKLGPLAFGKRDELVFLGREIGEQRNYSDEVAKQIDEEVRAIIDRGYQRAMDVLSHHRDKLDLIARELIERETLEAEEFAALFGEGDGGTGVAPTPVAPEPEPGAAPMEKPARPKPAPAPTPTPA
jgi:ATP-dependent Zn protease